MRNKLSVRKRTVRRWRLAWRFLICSQRLKESESSVSVVCVLIRTRKVCCGQIHS